MSDEQVALFALLLSVPAAAVMFVSARYLFGMRARPGARVALFMFIYLFVLAAAFLVLRDLGGANVVSAASMLGFWAAKFAHDAKKDSRDDSAQQKQNR